jgi:hypothetical protein
VNPDFATCTQDSKDNKRRYATTNRISITLADSVSRKLSERAFEEGRSISNLAAYLLERALETDED